MLDKKKILDSIAKELQNLGFGPWEQFSRDYFALNETITTCKVFPWNSVAESLQMDRWRLYHWYFETFQRMLLGSVAKVDQQTIKQMIRDALVCSRPLTKQFQQAIKARLTQEYHRSSFSIAFNNQKRQVMKELEKEPGIYREIQTFLVDGRRQISARSQQNSMMSEPQSPAQNAMLRAFVPVIQTDIFPLSKQSQHQQLLDYMNEESVTTTDFLQKMHSKIQVYSQQLELQKNMNPDDASENKQIDILVGELQRLAQEVDVLK